MKPLVPFPGSFVAVSLLLASHLVITRAFQDTESCADDLLAAGYWKGDDQSLNSGRRINGTRQAQRIIHAHQHPPDCSKVQFLIMGHWYGGIGGRLTFVAAALGAAMNRHQVLLLDFSEEVFTNGSFCSGVQTYDTCYLLPLSSCTLDDVYGAGTLAKAARGGLTLAQINEMRAAIVKTQNPRFIFQTEPWHYPWGERPRQTREVHLGVDSHRSHTRGAQWFFSHVYWWRMQGLAYVVRPNARLLDALRARREQVFKGRSIPRGTISVHVRHGDKWREAALVPNEAHGKGVFKLLDVHKDLERRVFISTEDPSAVTYFQSLIPSGLSEVLFADVVRNNLLGLAPDQVPNPTDEFVDSMLNLDLAMQCDAFICSLESRWCDLINRLRLTVRCKAERPMLCAQRLLQDDGEHAAMSLT